MDLFEKIGIRIGGRQTTAMHNAAGICQDGTDIIAWDAGIKEE